VAERLPDPDREHVDRGAHGVDVVEQQAQPPWPVSSCRRFPCGSGPGAGQINGFDD
jgi:hypothetical protein